MTFRVVSLFAGIGGFDLGLTRAGFEIVAHVEKDANCRKLLAARWPNAIALDDVCTAGKQNLPQCDVATFGFPCQDLSVAGKRAGLKGGRSGLFYEAMRIIDELQPAWCLWENVPGLLSSDDGRDLVRVLVRLAESHYFGCVRVLDAQWLGVAQRRRRCFGLFTRLDSGAQRACQVLSLSESMRWHHSPSREAGQGVAGRLESRTEGGGLPGTDGACAGHVVSCPITGNPYGDHESRESLLIPAIARSLNAGRDGYNDGSDQTYIPAVAGTLLSGTNRTRGTRRPGENGVDDVDSLIPAVAGCLQERDAKGADSDTKPGHLVPVFGFGGESDASSLSGAGDLQPPVTGRHGAPGFVAFQPRYFTRDNKTGGAESCGPVTAALSASHAGGDSAPCVAFHQNQRAEVTVNDTAGSLKVGGGKPGQGYPAAMIGMQVRRLTPTEAERLQGFPDGWTAGFSDSVRYKMLGNAVCVNVSEWIARRLKTAMETP